MSKPPCGVWPPTLSWWRVEPVLEDRNDRAALLVQHRLHFPDVGPALGFVRLAARVGEQLLELLVVPVRLVPGRARRVGDREHLRRRRAPAPVARDERALEPDVVPEAVGRLLLQVDLDAGLGRARLEQRALVDRAVERGVGRLQQDLRIGDARFLERGGGLVRIVLALRQLLVEVGIARRDRMIVADRAVSAEQRFQDLLAVGRQLQRHADVGIVVRRLVALHRHHRVPAAGGAHDLDLGRLRQQRHRLVVDAVDRVDLAGDQGVEPSRAVVDDRDLDGVEPAAPSFQ